MLNVHHFHPSIYVINNVMTFFFIAGLSAIWLSSELESLQAALEWNSAADFLSSSSLVSVGCSGFVKPMTEFSYLAISSMKRLLGLPSEDPSESCF